MGGSATSDSFGSESHPPTSSSSERPARARDPFISVRFHERRGGLVVKMLVFFGEVRSVDKRFFPMGGPDHDRAIFPPFMSYNEWVFPHSFLQVFERLGLADAAFDEATFGPTFLFLPRGRACLRRGNHASRARGSVGLTFLVLTSTRQQSGKEKGTPPGRDRFRVHDCALW